MSYQEKKTVTTIFTTLLVLGAYCLYAFGAHGPAATAPDSLKAWAGAMLIFVGVSIVATIVIQIVFHILLSVSIAVKESVHGNKDVDKAIKADMVEDERDKHIELKADKVGYILGGMGFLLGLIALLLDYSAVVMINILYFSFTAGSLAESIARLVFYRKGA